MYDIAKNDIKRGDIFYVMRDGMQTGSEIYHGRPAIVVSNDFLNVTSSLVEVVFLTTQPKKDLGTHVRITSTGRLSTALCEQITTVAVERLGNYIGTASDKEMREIDIAIGQSLSLSQNPPPSDGSTPTLDLAAIEKERDLYKHLYENLLDRILKKGG